MNLLEQIDQHEYLELTEIGEPDPNVLRIVVAEAKASSETRDIDLGTAKITDVHPIISDETCQEYEIIFGSYIVYAVLNESYASVDESEKFTGQFFRMYSKSHFLDYARAATLATEDYPGKFTHYEIVCLDHIVEVISVDEPEITILRRV
jgi:hypothetical protein